MPNGSGLGSKAAAKEHLLRGGSGVAGAVGEMTKDLAPLAALTVDEWTNPAAASTTAIKTAAAAVTAAVEFTGSALNGTVGGGTMSPPRNISITTAGSTPADAPATATITGFDLNGNLMTETINVPQTATTGFGTKAFAKVTKITMPAGQGTDCTVAFGFGPIIGLSKKIVTRAGLTGLVREIAAGALVTNGTIADATTGAPNGTYSPNSAPDGARDYAVYYEYDPLA